VLFGMIKEVINLTMFYFTFFSPWFTCTGKILHYIGKIKPSKHWLFNTEQTLYWINTHYSNNNKVTNRYTTHLQLLLLCQKNAVSLCIAYKKEFSSQRVKYWPLSCIIVSIICTHI